MFAFVRTAFIPRKEAEVGYRQERAGILFSSFSFLFLNCQRNCLWFRIAQERWIIAELWPMLDALTPPVPGCQSQNLCWALEMQGPPFQLSKWHGLASTFSEFCCQKEGSKEIGCWVQLGKGDELLEVWAFSNIFGFEAFFSLLGLILSCFYLPWGIRVFHILFILFFGPVSVFHSSAFPSLCSLALMLFGCEDC